jgi:hypothetical protein
VTGHIYRSDDVCRPPHVEGAKWADLAVADAHSLEAAGDKIQATADGSLGTKATPRARIALDGNLTSHPAEIAASPLFASPTCRSGSPGWAPSCCWRILGYAICESGRGQHSARSDSASAGQASAALLPWCLPVLVTNGGQPAAEGRKAG